MTDEAMSPLRRRMIEDMTIRKFAPKTHARRFRHGGINMTEFELLAQLGLR